MDDRLLSSVLGVLEAESQSTGQRVTVTGREGSCRADYSESILQRWWRGGE